MDSRTKEKIDNRTVANFQILDKLKKYLVQHSDMRFNQALINLGIVEVGKDLFYEESVDTLNKIGGPDDSWKS